MRLRAVPVQVSAVADGAEGSARTDVGSGVVGHRSTMKMDVVIEHVDIALRDWLGTTLDVDAVEFGRGGVAATDPSSSETTTSSSTTKKRGRKSASPTASLRLVGVTEQVDRRNNAVSDLRDDDGRVIGRRGAARVFDLDYVCVVDGDAIEAHHVLGQLIGLLIDHDTVPVDFVPVDAVPAELTMRDIPIEVELSPPDVAERAAASTFDACVAVRATVPIWPSLDTQIGEPAEHLHLEVGPEPGATEPRGSTTGGVDGVDRPVDPTERTWTTVRRREFIAPGSTAASAGGGG